MTAKLFYDLRTYQALYVETTDGDILLKYTYTMFNWPELLLRYNVRYV